jgi:hypothetical protein
MTRAAVLLGAYLAFDAVAGSWIIAHVTLPLLRTLAGAL